MVKKASTIGILTGGGDVPGLNPAIRAVTIRALREGYRVIGIRRGWGGLVDVIREKDANNENNFRELTEDLKIVYSQLRENAVALGAASLVMQRVFAQLW